MLTADHDVLGSVQDIYDTGGGHLGIWVKLQDQLGFLPSKVSMTANAAGTWGVRDLAGLTIKSAIR